MWKVRLAAWRLAGRYRIWERVDETVSYGTELVERIEQTGSQLDLMWQRLAEWPWDLIGAGSEMIHES